VIWNVEALTAAHERGGFSCGHEPLDLYIREYAGQHARKFFGRTFVAVRSGSPRVLGYYTLSSSSVAFERAPEPLKRKLPRYPLPIALLGKLAVDQTVQGQGLGGFLLMDALRRIADISTQMGIFAVEVHALSEQARAFYEKYGFQSFRDTPSHLFLPVATFKQLF